MTQISCSDHNGRQPDREWQDKLVQAFDMVLGEQSTPEQCIGGLKRAQVNPTRCADTGRLVSLETPGGVVRQSEITDDNLAAARFATEATDFAIKLETIESMYEVVEQALALIARFGFTSMFFGGVPRMRQTFANATMAHRGAEEWLTEYTRKEYVWADPVIPAIRRSTRALLWSEIPIDAEQCPEGAAIMRRRRDYGFNQGLVVPIHTPSGPPYFVSMSGADVALTPAARQIVPLMARCAFERIQDVGHEMVQRCSLTAREREILSWVARGECAAEIGHVLNIAARTVETHIRHACLKLRASNRAHAVAIALSDRHIQV